MTTPTAAPTAGASNAKQAAPAPAPFRVGTQNTVNLDGYVQSTTVTDTSAAVQLPVLQPLG
ncbi:MAG: hypothetical protein WBE13_03170 [Candidatus Acidiferrum sp.]